MIIIKKLETHLLIILIFYVKSNFELLYFVALYGWDSDEIPDCVQYFSGYLDTRFFHAYGIDCVIVLGEAWGQAVTEYLDKFINSGNLWDYKTAQQWIIFGDPSLKIGV